MTLAQDEFIRRFLFLLHLLPRGFHRIRYYRFLAGGARKASLTLARKLQKVAPEPDPDTAAESTVPLMSHDPASFRPPCRCCGGRMIVIEVFERTRQLRGPPFSATTNREKRPGSRMASHSYQPQAMVLCGKPACAGCSDRRRKSFVDQKVMPATVCGKEIRHSDHIAGASLWMKFESLERGRSARRVMPRGSTPPAFSIHQSRSTH